MRPIDADALIKKWENVHSKDMSFTMAIIGATNDVKKAPTIDAVPVRHGKWIRNDKGRYACDQCNCEAQVIRSPYCPNCGARMDE